MQGDREAHGERGKRAAATGPNPLTLFDEGQRPSEVLLHIRSTCADGLGDARRHEPDNPSGTPGDTHYEAFEQDDPVGARLGSPFRLDRSDLRDRLGGFVYGTILALGVVIATAKGSTLGAATIAAAVAVTSGVFWLAHVYSHGLALTLEKDQRLTRTEIGQLARREAAILEAAIPPVLFLLLGALGVISEDVAIWGAVVFGVVVLGVLGVVVARVRRLGPGRSVAVVVVNLAFGLALVALKLLLGH